MSLLNKIGFYQTLRLLDTIGGKITLKTFYAKFNEGSYYNAHLRVRKALLDAKLIRISKHKSKKFIELTGRGYRVWTLLDMISDLIGGGSA